MFALVCSARQQAQHVYARVIGRVVLQCACHAVVYLKLLRFHTSILLLQLPDLPQSGETGLQPAVGMPKLKARIRDDLAHQHL